MAATEAGITVVPANEASCADLQAIFGTRGQGHDCQCQRFKLRRPARERGSPGSDGR